MYKKLPLSWADFYITHTVHTKKWYILPPSLTGCWRRSFKEEVILGMKAWARICWLNSDLKHCVARLQVLEGKSTRNRQYVVQETAVTIRNSCDNLDLSYRTD